jgi:hypothetical protein
MKDRRIVRYNVDFCFRDFKYVSGAVAIDLSDVNDMKARVIAEWSPEYAEKHVRRVIGDATGIRGGWTIEKPEIINNNLSSSVKVYEFKILSRLYPNLRRIYERSNHD